MARGPVSATELAAALRVDRSTVVRALSLFGEDLVTFGATRSTRYALRRTVFPIGERWPVYRIGETGRASLWATLESYHDRQWRVLWPEAARAPAWAGRFLDADGMWEGFPFFLADLRPQGFLGRAIARHLPRLLGLPEDPRWWSDDHTLRYLQAEAKDPPGALVVGDECLRLALSRPSGESIAEADRPARYAELAASATEVAPGSSAGGEQPKFLTRINDRFGERDVIVKFSPPIDQATGRRWADLLACEWLASEILAEKGLAFPGTTILDAGGRRFLESPRFDRTADGGRRGVVSLAALHPETDSRGSANAWRSAAAEMEKGAWIAGETRDTIILLHAFGECIGNTDRHGGNLAFWLDDALPFRLAPVYDMLPMLWAPGAQGELVERTFSPSPPLPGDEKSWVKAANWAMTFWARAEELPELSADFRRIAHDASATLRERHSRFA